MRGYSKARLNDLKLDFYNLDSSQPIHIRLENKEKRDLKIKLFEQKQNNVSLNTDDTNILSNVEEGEYGLRFDFKTMKPTLNHCYVLTRQIQQMQLALYQNNMSNL